MAYASVWLISLDKALKLIEKCEYFLNKFEEGTSKVIRQKQASLNYIKSLYYFFKSDSDNALKHAEQSLEVREEIGNKLEIAESINIIGVIYTYFKYDWDHAIAYLEKSKILAEECNQKHIIAYNLMSFGVLYALKGELEQSVSILKQSQELFKKLGNKRHLSQSFNIIANIYKQKGNLEQSLECLEQALKLSEEIGNKWTMGYTLSTIIEICVSKKDNKKALKYLEMFKQINDDQGNKMMSILYSLSEALVLKMSPRIRNRAKAEELLRQIIKEESITGDISIIALVNLFDLLLVELRTTNDLEIFNELKPLINQLITISEKTKSFWILTETYLLQAKLSLVDFKMKKAQRFLIQAQQIAKRYDLEQLTIKITNENEDLLKKLDLWEKLKETNASLADRLELARLDEQIIGMVQNLTELTPQITEENVAISKDKKICLVCRGEILRYTYICECGALYCENCARAITDLENVCWVCDIPIDYSKPTKAYQNDEMIRINDKGKKSSGNN